MYNCCDVILVYTRITSQQLYMYTGQALTIGSSLHLLRDTLILQLGLQISVLPVAVQKIGMGGNDVIILHNNS